MRPALVLLEGMTNNGICDGCGTQTPAASLVISMMQGRQRVCQSCAIDEQTRSTKAGIAKSYWIGAGIVLVAFVIVALRVLGGAFR